MTDHTDAQHSAQYGDYGVTVNTGVCGTLNSGSIPDSRPRSLSRFLSAILYLESQCKPAPRSFAGSREANMSKLLFAFLLADVAQVVRAQHS